MAEIPGSNLFGRARISRIDVKVPTLLFIALVAAQAQVYPGGYPGGGYPGGGYPGGGYPGGGYPGGGYPGGYPGGQYPQTGPGIPIPRRSKKNDSSKNGAQPLPNFRGTLKVFEEKSISVGLGDNRVLDFKRTDKTKFFRNGNEVKSPKFNLGDQVSVEASDDGTGYMTAVNVYWEKAAGEAPAKTDDGVYDTWKDQPSRANDDPDRPVLRRADSGSTSNAKPPADNPSAQATPRESAAPPRSEAAAPPRSETATEAAPPPARPDPDDPGPPVLKRGGVADPKRERAPKDFPDTPVQVASAAPGAPRPNAPEAPRPSVIPSGRDEDTSAGGIERKPDQPLIRRAADAALAFTEGLPAYVCTEAITRYQSETQPANFHALDVVSTDVVYENGREDYRNLMINGKKTTKTMEESGGAWSTGEFGTILINLFAPQTSAQFHFRRDSRVGSIMAKMYDFEVERERSNWQIHMSSQTYIPAYTGTVWIDPQTARVLRIEMEGKGLPESFPIDHVEAVTEYSYVRLGDAQQYLLPVHAENLSCQRGTPYCSRNVIDFRNYHKYTGEASIKFGGEAKEDKKQ